MSKLKLTTLTPLHIGSGNVLQKDCDFVCGKDAEGNPVVGVVDPRKVLALVGEENVDAWTVAIENGRGTDDIVRQYAPKATVADYSRHFIDMRKLQSRKPHQIKEFVRDGFDRPYIPGSSIKGAIRTAVFADAAAKINDNSLSIRDFKGHVNVKPMESRIFGKDPFNDAFRYLLVGDAIVKDCRTAVYDMVNINEREKKSFWDTDKLMATEVLPRGTVAEFSLALKQPARQPGYMMPNRQKGNCQAEMPPAIKALTSVETLLNVINNHTRWLLASEIETWENNLKTWKNRENFDETAKAKVAAYVSRLHDLLHVADGCKGTCSAVMRMGHDSGWRFITGAWTERLAGNDREAVIDKARYKNEEKYKGFAFPKSRRMEERNCELLGFVKLELEG